MESLAALPPPALITRPAQLSQMLKQLCNESAVAVDTESNSMYVYHEQVCLVQFSIPGQDFLVDPLAGLDISPCRELFADPGVEKVFHAAEYDILCLKRHYGFEFQNLFDTMWAARILGWPSMGLAAILKEHFGVQLDKRWQRYNWGQRPLERAALLYARLDTHYLLELHTIQWAQLRAAGRLEEAREIFDQVAQTTPTPHTFDPDDFWHVKGVWDLTGREQAIVRELYAYREREAQRQNKPPFRILGDRTLIALAQAQPRRLEDLRGLDGMTAGQIARYGHGVLEAIARGRQATIPASPTLSRPDERILSRYQALRAWRNGVARRRGVEPDVIMSNATLMSLAHRAPATLTDLEGIEGLGPWRRTTYGEQVLQVLRDM